MPAVGKGWSSAGGGDFWIFEWSEFLECRSHPATRGYGRVRRRWTRNVVVVQAMQLFGTLCCSMPVLVMCEFSQLLRKIMMLGRETSTTSLLSRLNAMMEIFCPSK